ncbi:hypothetical protein VOLCADRAFT_106930 [Volvox carteri f. nagariensis]|uniref:Ribosome-recycling factor, chloroplastic n=1 Tax=Volvox carteri f. nagariensis TaxID=3068 RepID=D8UAM6_VOLCA|nr:uncharacterized protein VOLCADRAFT_106930 [Volvox carteri f. nagariensis]EFJ43178.1 hypothetical protein VOLCADRAFT_106930 [Volvox carteri f. nagariensis]|eukprot:XP_002955753.1 hypothetical protein VOLCADRAFT_106930 [Volvox carteri f. nagariensis]
MYGHIRTASCLLACVARVPSHVASRHGWEHVCLSAEASCAPADEAPEDVFQLSNGPGGGSKHRGAGRDKGAAAVGEEAPLEFDLAPFVSQMRSALEHYQKELAGIRTGRASPGLLEGVMVGESSHGKHVPVRALGTVVVRNPHLLVVEVYNPQDAQPLAEAIQSSPLKLQARVEGLEVLVEVPRLTMDMVERMVRLAGQEAEAARAEVRRARHKALDLAKRVAAGGGVSKEETKRREVQVQVATDKHIAEVDALLRAKETELREKH